MLFRPSCCLVIAYSQTEQVKSYCLPHCTFINGRELPCKLDQFLIVLVMSYREEMEMCGKQGSLGFKLIIKTEVVSGFTHSGFLQRVFFF